MSISRKRTYVASMGAVLSLGLLVAGCGDNGGSAGPTTGATTGATGGTTSASVPQVGATDFTSDFSKMKELTDLASKGKGLIGVLLPDTTTSTRYVQYDAPYLKQAFEAAGLSSDQFKIDNAQGSASTMQTQAEADINAGASVLLVDALDPGSGAAIESKAAAAGVKVIDYDRLASGGPEDRYYVSFDNVKVGQLIGQGMVDCITDWKVGTPNLLVMNGDPKDNNAKLFSQGYHSVLDPKFKDGSYTKVGEPAGTWDPSTAATTFQQQRTAHPNINATVTPNDDNANAVISALQSAGVKANTFPTTGQDASLPGLQNILKGYQCGTVYKPIYLEAQAAAALALYLRAGETPPETLVNAETDDSVLGKKIKSVYTTPIWVTTDNMAKTVVKDKAVEVTKLCAGAVAPSCVKAAIQ